MCPNEKIIATTDVVIVIQRGRPGRAAARPVRAVIIIHEEFGTRRNVLSNGTRRKWPRDSGRLVCATDERSRASTKPSAADRERRRRRQQTPSETRRGFVVPKTKHAGPTHTHTQYTNRCRRANDTGNWPKSRTRRWFKHVNKPTIRIGPRSRVLTIPPFTVGHFAVPYSPRVAVFPVMTRHRRLSNLTDR